MVCGAAFVKENKHKTKRSQVCPSAWGLLEKIQFGENLFPLLASPTPNILVAKQGSYVTIFSQFKKDHELFFQKKNSTGDLQEVVFHELGGSLGSS